MKNIIFDCDNDLALKTTKYIASIFCHAEGSTEQQFNSLCSVGLKKLIGLESVCWDVIPESSQSSSIHILSHSIVIQNSQKQTDRSHVLSIVRNDNKPTFSPTDINIVKFIFPHLIEGYYHNKLSTLEQHDCLPNCYNAVCDKQLNIIEAEANFFKLLNNYFDDEWDKEQLPIVNLSNWEIQKKVELNNIMFDLTKLEGTIYIKAYYIDSRFSLLTPREKQITILLLKEVPETTILCDLCISRKTLDNHLRNIFYKFDISAKKELIPSIISLSN